MSTHADVHKTQLLAKIDRLLSEFAEGKVSREQFHAIYEHYNSQLAMIENLSAHQEVSSISPEAGTTIAIRQAHMGKALGLIIYHNRSGTFVDTLGDFDVAPSLMSSTLNDFSHLMEARKLIDRRVLKIPGNRWLLFAPGRHSTVVTLFHHEPSPAQIREIERLHHDFEIANAIALDSPKAINKNELAYPFLVFVQKKLKR